MAIGIHLVAALGALIVGGWQLARAKGTKPHRWLGWLWITTMAITALSSFWIDSAFAMIGPFGPIHLLSVWTLLCLVIAVYGVRQRRLRLHRQFVIGAYLGLVGAGLATLAPGRLVATWLWGL